MSLDLTKLDPWSEDATRWTDTDFDYLKAFGDRAVLDFCVGTSSKPDTWLGRGTKCILVGRRGLGKSFLLAYRSHYHRRDGAAATYFHPSGGYPRRLVEKLTSLSGAVPDKHWLRSADATDSWSAVWQISILGLLVWRFCEPRENVREFQETFREIEELYEPYSETFADPAHSTSSEEDPDRAAVALQWFLGRLVEALPSERSECQSIVAKLLFAATTDWTVAIKRAITKNKRRRIALYLDNPDELVPPTSSGDLWTNVQLGLVLAIWKMQKGGGLTDELNIYACIRSEALSQKIHPDLKHALDLAIHLRYDHQMLYRLFESRCALTHSDRLTYPEIVEANPVKAFLGFERFAHQDRRNADGTAQIEDAVEALIRHTRLVPRELIGIGKQISQLRPLSQRTEDAVRTCVNAEAGQIIGYVFANCHPPWQPRLEKLLCSINSQVLSGTEMYSLAREHNPSEEAATEDIKYLVSLGLLGYAEPDPKRHRHFYFQRFVFDEPYGHASSLRLQRDYFFIHPALKEWIRARHAPQVEWRHQVNLLVGDGLPFESSPPLLRLMIRDSFPSILLGGETPLQGIGTGSSNQINFLFLALCAWKLRNGETWPTMRDITKIASQLKQKHPDIKFPSIKPDQNPEGSQVRVWARRLNKANELRSLQASFESSVADGDGSAHVGRVHKPKAPDRRRSGFITISAPSESNADASFAFPKVHPLDVHISEEVLSAIAL